MEREGREREGTAREREDGGCAPRRRIGLKGNPGSAVQRPRVAPPAAVSARFQPSDRRSEPLGLFVTILATGRAVTFHFCLLSFMGTQMNAEN